MPRGGYELGLAAELAEAAAAEVPPWLRGPAVVEADLAEAELQRARRLGGLVL